MKSLLLLWMPRPPLHLYRLGFALLYAAWLCVASGWARPAIPSWKPTRRTVMTSPQTNLAEAAHSFVLLMQNPKVSIATLTPHLGHELYHQRPDASSPSTYYFAPSDPRFQDISVDLDHFPLGGEAPYDLELTLADHALLHLHDLSQVFGQWHRLPMMFEEPPTVEFKFNASHQKCRVTLDAELDTLPEGANPRVRKLTIFRYANSE